MPTEPSLHYRRYDYLNPASGFQYSFTLGLPESTYLEVLKTCCGNSAIDGIILNGLLDWEGQRLKAMLGINVSLHEFKVFGSAPHPDHLVGLESFNGEEGRKFWIYPRETL
jgi:hypothetical protein